MKRLLLLTFFLSSLAWENIYAAPQLFQKNIHGEPDPSIWMSKWCDDGQPDQNDYKVLQFRRTFDLKKVPEKFNISVSADNRYRLFVNGKSVAAGPARGDVRHWYYDDLDLAPYLKEGKNVIAALVWDAGAYKPCSQMTLRTGFLLDGSTEAEKFVSTPNVWKVKRSAAYSPIISRGLDTGCGDRVDGTLYDWGWTLPDFDDSKWKSPKAICTTRTIDSFVYEGNWLMTPRAIPFPEETLSRLKEIRRSSGIESVPNFISGKEEFTIPPNTKCSILLDNGVLTTAYPKLFLSKGKGATIDIKYAEALFDSKGNKGNRNDIEGRDFHPWRFTRDIFLPDGGDNREFSSLWYRTYRYVGLNIETKDEPLVIKDFYGMFTSYPFEEKGFFSSNDESIGKIWETGWRTARLCAHEQYMDCPYYEQLQYIGDTRIQALISLYVSGDDRLMRQAIELFDASRNYTGLTTSRYPSFKEQVIPPFSLYWISMIHDYARFRGDVDFIRKFIPGIDSVLYWFTDKLDKEKGMLKPRLRYWHFADWCTTPGRPKGYHDSGWDWGIPPEGPDAGSAINTLHLAYTLRQASEMMKLLGENSNAEKYDKYYKEIVSAVYSRCFDKDKGIFMDYEGSKYSSQNVNIMAILADALPKSEQPKLMEKILSDKSLTQCTFYYRFYLTEAMRKVGMGDRYVSQLTPWRDMINMGLTTFAENPEPARSDCHAWSSSPNYHLLSVVCGIEPIGWGFKEVKIAPSFGELTEISGGVPHPLGMIKMSMKRVGKESIEGEVILPKNLNGKFEWNGKELELKEGSNKIAIGK